MGSVEPWEQTVLDKFKITDADGLQQFYNLIMADKRVMEAAMDAGWEESYDEFTASRSKFTPGAFRRYNVGLPIYMGDRLQEGQWGEEYSMRGARFSSERVFSFIRERLNAFLTRGDPRTVPSPAASSSVVMAMDPSGVWWPARLLTFKERLKLIQESRTRKEKGTSVVLLLYNENPHQYYMAEKCCRITTKELEEVYKLAKAGDFKPGQNLVVRPRLPAGAITQSKLKRFLERFCEAAAFALALDRTTPHGVSIHAPCANDDAVHSFTVEQLENPLTLQLEKDKSFAFALESLRLRLPKNMDAQAAAAAAAGGAGGGGAGGGSGGSHMAVVHSQGQSTRELRLPPSTRELCVLPDHDSQETEDEEINSSAGGMASRGKRPASSPTAHGSAAAAAVIPSTAPSTSSAAAASAAAAAGATSAKKARAATASSVTGAGAASGGGGAGPPNGSGSSSSNNELTKLLEALENAMQLVGVQETHKGKLDHFRNAAQAFTEGGPASATAAMEAFTALWLVVIERLEQQRAQQASLHTISNNIRDGLAASGLPQEDTDAVIEDQSLQPLQQRLNAVLEANGWVRANLEAKGGELQQNKAEADKGAAFLRNLRDAPAFLSADWRASTQAEMATVVQRAKELEAALQQHSEAMRLLNASVDRTLGALVQLLPRVVALHTKHENTLLALWGSFITRVAGRRGRRRRDRVGATHLGLD